MGMMNERNDMQSTPLTAAVRLGSSPLRREPLPCSVASDTMKIKAVLQNMPLEDHRAVSAAHVVCDLSRKAFVVHEKKVDLLHIADQELLVSVWHKMAGLHEHQPSTHVIICHAHLLVAAVANLGHGELALEPTPHSVINTLGFPPCLLNTVVTIGLVAPMQKL